MPAVKLTGDGSSWSWGFVQQETDLHSTVPTAKTMSSKRVTAHGLFKRPIPDRI
jgi:hypothetical protein